MELRLLLLMFAAAGLVHCKAGDAAKPPTPTSDGFTKVVVPASPPPSAAAQRAAEPAPELAADAPVTVARVAAPARDVSRGLPWQPMAAGDSKLGTLLVSDGRAFSTGPKGQLLLDLPTGVRVELEPNSAFVFAADAAHTLLLLRGGLHVQLLPGNTRRAEARVATAELALALGQSVDLWLQAQPDRTRVAVFAGEATLEAQPREDAAPAPPLDAGAAVPPVQRTPLMPGQLISVTSAGVVLSKAPSNYGGVGTLRAHDAEAQPKPRHPAAKSASETRALDERCHALTLARAVMAAQHAEQSAAHAARDAAHVHVVQAEITQTAQRIHHLQLDWESLAERAEARRWLALERAEPADPEPSCAAIQ